MTAVDTVIAGAGIGAVLGFLLLLIALVVLGSAIAETIDRARARRHAREQAPAPAGPQPVGDDTLSMLARARQHDDDTFLSATLDAELKRLLDADGGDRG